MTAKDSIASMKTMGYYERWLLPKLDVNIGAPFQGAPTGNSPEMVALDASLNKDLDDGVHRRIVFTNHLPSDDSKKLSMETSRKGLHVYLRVWNTPPEMAVDGTSLNGGVPGASGPSRILKPIKIIREKRG
jgi:hypothetical protein